MFEWIKARVLLLMRVPHEPEAPLGAPGSIRVFRAGLNHYRIKLARWAAGQSGALVGIGFSLVFLGALEAGVEQARRIAALPAVSEAASSTPGETASPAPSLASSPAPAISPTAERSPSRADRDRGRERIIRALVTRTPGFVMPLIRFLEFAGIAAFFAQVLLTYAIVRLEFEQHWYIVTDRSLRIRTGILRLQESTMSFANIQQVEIQQGPLQRLLGLANVCVRSAGGGDSSEDSKGHAAEPSLHTGTFEGVSNAVEIRDLILERLRKFREAGLGDPEDGRTAAPQVVDRKATDAARSLLYEARALRSVLLREKPATKDAGTAGRLA